jgi:hypothetical protein
LRFALDGSRQAGQTNSPAGFAALMRCAEYGTAARFVSVGREIGRNASATEVGDVWVRGRSCSPADARRGGQCEGPTSWPWPSGRSEGSELAYRAMVAGCCLERMRSGGWMRLLVSGTWGSHAADGTTALYDEPQQARAVPPRMVFPTPQVRGGALKDSFYP